MAQKPSIPKGTRDDTLLQLLENYRLFIKRTHTAFLESKFKECDDRLISDYTKYARLDSNYPRPILSFLGINYQKDFEHCPDIEDLVDSNFILIPQFVRDFLAIHDDIIDEDTNKFGEDTLPMSLSRLQTPSTEHMTKVGNDLALLHGDCIIPVIYDIVCDSSLDAERKTAIISRINNTLYYTNIGQIQELLMQQKLVENCSEMEIQDMYKIKAADYCYVFPFEIGVLYQGGNLYSPQIAQTHTILLEIGCVSQILDDLIGVFFETSGNQKNTLNELLFLRRSFLLKRTATRLDEDKILNGILHKDYCDLDEASYIKNLIIKRGVGEELVLSLMERCQHLKAQVNNLKIGSLCKAYFLYLIDTRLEVNLKRFYVFFEQNKDK